MSHSRSRLDTPDRSRGPPTGAAPCSCHGVRRRQSQIVVLSNSRSAISCGPIVRKPSEGRRYSTTSGLALCPASGTQFGVRAPTERSTPTRRPTHRLPCGEPTHPSRVGGRRPLPSSFHENVRHHLQNIVPRSICRPHLEPLQQVGIGEHTHLGLNPNSGNQPLF